MPSMIFTIDSSPYHQYSCAICGKDILPKARHLWIDVNLYQHARQDAHICFDCGEEIGKLAKIGMEPA